MKYLYCEKCKKPIRSYTTFDRAVNNTKTSPLKISETCIMSSRIFLCKECYMKEKQETDNPYCDCVSCINMKDDKCECFNVV